jgi:hypothetical protein
MALPGLVAAQNLADVADRERAWDNLGLNISANFNLDADAENYIRAVEVADNAFLEPLVQFALNNFIVGCKTDGIWSAIKASCILAGARTRLGALTPLTGTAPTSFNFVDGDYNRKTGLAGNGSTKRLDSNRNNNADPQNSKHISAWVSSLPTFTTNRGLMGAGFINVSGVSTIYSVNNTTVWTNINSSTGRQTDIPAIGLWAANRQTSTQFTSRVAGVSTNTNSTSQVPLNATIQVFGDPGGAANPSDARIAFYSIGESLNLALLDARVTDLINAIGAAF